jgi:hypothetical protein
MDCEAMRDELAGIIQQAENTWKLSGAGTNDERLAYIANDVINFLRAHFEPKGDDSDLLTIAYMSGREDGKREKAKPEPAQDAKALVYNILRSILSVDMATFVNTTQVEDKAATDVERYGQDQYNAGYAVAVKNLAASRPADAALRKTIEAEIVLLEAWADESRRGGWSTHQVDPMRRRANALRAALASSPAEDEKEGAND